MPPVRTGPGRASKACDACRARKTRCYESEDAAKACLRCSTHRLECSLQESSGSASMRLMHHSCAGMEDRMNHLERTVERLSKAVGDLARQTTPRRSAAYEDDERSRQDAPLVVIQDAVRDSGTIRYSADGLRAAESAQNEEANAHASSRDRANIISKGMLGTAETQDLLSIFQRHYGRWIAISEQANEILKAENIESSILLCSCCLVAVRHSSDQHAISLPLTLFNEARNLLGHCLLDPTQSIEFFQAVLVLSLWPTTTGGKLLSMDPWLMTGFALQHGAISNAFSMSLKTGRNDATQNLLIWNHLCLSHLHACVSMRRNAMIGTRDLEKGRHVIESENTSNFEIRMVAELHLYWTIYENCVTTSVNLPQAQAALKAWKDDWTYLFDQPRPQFLHISFYFAQLMMYEQSLNSKSAAVRESLLSEMVRLSCALLDLAMETSDERTKYLTDHIYHMIAFAAVTLCRLLYKYEAQLKSKHDIDGADAIVSRTVRWLDGIGMASHIGSMMGNLIKAVQQKLRPSAKDLSLSELEPEPLQAEDLLIPDFLGMDSIDFDWDATIPDWQSLTSDDFLSPFQPTGF